jgi:hypothetical protein
MRGIFTSSILAGAGMGAAALAAGEWGNPAAVWKEISELSVMRNFLAVA